MQGMAYDEQIGVSTGEETTVIRYLLARLAFVLWVAAMLWVVIDCPVQFFLSPPGYSGL